MFIMCTYIHERLFEKMNVMFLMFVCFVLHGSYTADHGTFKDCSRTDFCTSLRSRLPFDDYVVDRNSITISSDYYILSATLISSNTGGSNLTVSLSGLQQSTFRLKIKEVDSTRYELQDVLSGEPEQLGFDTVDIGPDFVTATTDGGSNSVVIMFSPFSIIFSKQGVSEVVFNGDRLTMQMNRATAPFSFGVTFPQAFNLYGIHEHCDTLPLKNTILNGSDPYRLKNLDVSYYEIESTMALYGAVPVIYGHGPHATAGIFLHNAAEQWAETVSDPSSGSEVYFMAETGTLDLFVLLGPTISQVVRQYTTLTGVTNLPPFWSLGYHQSRYSYDTQTLVEEVISDFDNNYFQMDAIWLDIDFTDGYKYFTWNLDNFNDPVAMQTTIERKLKKLVVITAPHIKVEPGYAVYDGALANDFFVKTANDSVYEGPCWPGSSSYIDFLNPAAVDYYANLYSFENFPNTTSTLAGIWTDMNEPTVFDNSLEMTLPPDALHYGNVAHREIHGIYGLLHSKASYQGLLNRNNNESRPFILTRSHFAGSQRYTAFWTGENQADWPYLLASFQECLNANLLGLVFCGADIGGFFYNPDNELLERWYQAGAWLPFFRAHSSKDSNRREPYLLSEDSQSVIRNAINVRYKHLPQWYTLFYEHSITGDPVIRPLFYQYPEDINTYTIDNHLMLGRDILIRAVTEPGVDTVEMYFPGSELEVWFSIWLSDLRRGNGWLNITINRDTIPIYYRRGGIVVRQNAHRPSTTDMNLDEYILFAAYDDNGEANGTIYLDATDGFAYRDSNDFNYNSLFIDNLEQLHITPLAGNGNFSFNILTLIRKDIVTLPEMGRAGRSIDIIYAKLADGTPLKEVTINAKEKTVLKLK